MVPGTHPGVLELDGVIVGDIICFEVAYDDLVYDVVRGGAGMLVVQTNNATYMGTGQIEQQFATARLRALETGRYVVVVATNGVSGIVGPEGEIVERLPTRETALMQRDIPQMAGESPAVKFGVPIRWVLGSVGLVAMLWGLSVQRRRRGSDFHQSASREENQQ
jgi:apolipoprotein N-acyltransferase